VLDVELLDFVSLYCECAGAYCDILGFLGNMTYTPVAFP
jgi:hypothetical protein